MNDLQHYLSIAKYVATEAGKYLKSNFGSYKKMYHKQGTHYTIQDDAEADKIYKKLLTKKSPDVDFYSEESTGKFGKNLTWIVDSIEGTSNYRVGIPFFATQIALIKKKEILVSVVHAPVLNITYHAVQGGGAYKDEKQINVSKLKEHEKALVSLNKGTEAKYLKWYAKTIVGLSDKVRTFRNFGATGLELAYAADSKIDAHLNYGSRLYDLIPGALLITEAGGTLLTHGGKNWTINDDLMIAANKTLAQKLYDFV